MQLYNYCLFLTFLLLWLGKSHLFAPVKDQMSKAMKEPLVPFEVRFDLPLCMVYIDVHGVRLLIYYWLGLITSVNEFDGFSLFKQCRQAKISYTGKFMAEVCFEYGNKGVAIRDNFNFGQIPIMLKVCVIWC